jgi:hypothetical protein
MSVNVGVPQANVESWTVGSRLCSEEFQLIISASSHPGSIPPQRELVAPYSISNNRAFDSYRRILPCYAQTQHFLVRDLCNESERQ